MIDITDNDIDSIIKNTNDCNNLKLFIDDYLSRRKPSGFMEKVYKL